ncbi:MAG: rRNA pseudouridine synthase [Fibrobacter sp.]|uniref:pseudouridine synthase n=1 Tax=Fibrobacter sp. TaxID=35828 RepID=UPI00388EB219|nr:rRNA pseudouridine synthase [Fibrobacter sp.]
MRINKFISLCGIASRRAADTLVAEGHVQVNGETINDLGHQVDETKDQVTVDGKIAKLPQKTKAILFHKPAGCVCTKDDPQGRRTVYDYLPPGYQSFKYVGRLDLQSRGLLLFTDDGELLHRLTHPSFEIPRSYYVWTTKPLSENAAQKLVDGVDISDPEDPNTEEDIAFATDVYLEKGFAELVLIEGKNREIRRMMRAIGYEIRDLKRVSYCHIQLGDLAAGEFRELTADEMNKLKQAVHL